MLFLEQVSDPSFGAILKVFDALPEVNLRSSL
jgi:hypothetical protein